MLACGELDLLYTISKTSQLFCLHLFGHQCLIHKGPYNCIFWNLFAIQNKNVLLKQFGGVEVFSKCNKSFVTCLCTQFVQTHLASCKVKMNVTSTAKLSPHQKLLKFHHLNQTHFPNLPTNATDSSTDYFTWKCFSFQFKNCRCCGGSINKRSH